MKINIMVDGKQFNSFETAKFYIESLKRKENELEQQKKIAEEKAKQEQLLQKRKDKESEIEKALCTLLKLADEYEGEYGIRYTD